jgi:hypothetical protein
MSVLFEMSAVCYLTRMLTFATTDFSWDKTCGLAMDPSTLLYYPNNVESTCDQKVVTEFEFWDMQKYLTKDDCCKDKFPNDISGCCKTRQGECSLSGHSVYLPNWLKQECIERDENLLTEWEVEWSSDTAAACCKKCKQH